MIFISYRRTDSESVVGRIYSELKKHFPTQDVFLDHDSIPLGKPFLDVIRERIVRTKYFLVLIGPDWLSRLEDPNDFVRLEVETALATPDVTVIPVLVNRAQMPPSGELPESLQPLLNRHGISVRPDPDFYHDIERLVRALGKLTAPSVFASYSLKDRQHVVPFIEKLKKLGVNVFYDGDLQPGSDWKHELAVALDTSSGMIVFVSPRSMQSEWVRREITAALSEQAHKRVVPIILEQTPDLPDELRARQWVDISGDRSETELWNAARRIADAFAGLKLPEPTPADQTTSRIPDPEEQSAIKSFVEELKNEYSPMETASPPDSVFIVHGHDEKFLAEVEAYLTSIHIKPLVLKRLGGGEQSLFQKFLHHGGEAHFALVLLSADDYGSSLSKYHTKDLRDRDVYDKALQFRARQNVILELGFFYGRLGWQNVFILGKRPPRDYPEFEAPSDLGGIVFDYIDTPGWKLLLGEQLRKAGFVISERSDS
jgi:predicted nucleotide-binding protein